WRVAQPGKFRTSFGARPSVLALRADHARRIAVVFLAEIVEGLVARGPAQVPASRPGLRVRAGIIERGFVLELIEIRARDVLDEMRLGGVGDPFAREPETLVEPNRVDHERVALPVTDRVSVP